uniref:Uncharacterized protein n=1 Tax=Ralstonia solanacearum TaxID=305 RepID=A0A0S4WH21_RALSL|nr:protein of unknown function [Ralstonia solanacearum]
MASSIDVCRQPDHFEKWEARAVVRMDSLLISLAG